MSNPLIDICEHVEENLIAWADFDDYAEEWCGNKRIHNPHDNCMGIMCDYGCNESEAVAGLVLIPNVG